MPTHLHLIYDQLDVLINLLVEETGTLFAEPAALNPWQYDDIQALADAVDVVTEGILGLPEHLQAGYSLREVGDELLNTLAAVLERSSALLQDDTLPEVIIRRLQIINSTAYDMYSIVSEIFDL